MENRVPWAEEDLAMSRSHAWLRVLVPVALAAALALGCVAYRNGGGTYRERAPRGSYLASCEGIRVDGHRLKASCRTNRGTWRRSSLDLRVCDDDIVNRDGYLRCSHADRYYGALPPGSYLRSCTHVKVIRGRLEADCRRDNHKWRETKISVNACERFRNQNGNLACE
jgi:hypothetical protein